MRVPVHVDEVLLAGNGVVKERRVEARGVNVDSVGPGACDGRGGGNIVVRVFIVAVVALHVGVDEPEAAVAVREARRPHAAAVGISAEVEESRAV